MIDTNAKAFEEKLLTIDLVDGLRREQERLDLALNDAEQMKALRTQIQAYYQQAGINVSDALIDQAIAERQAQRNVFKPSKLSTLGKLVATAYVFRRRIALTLGALAAITLFAWYLDHQISSWQQARELEAYRDGLQRQLDALQAVQQQIAALPTELAALVEPDNADGAAIPALPQWSSQFQLGYAAARLALRGNDTCADLTLPSELAKPWPGESALTTCSAQQPALQQALQQASALQRDHEQLATSVQRYALLQQRVTALPALQNWQAVSAALTGAQANTVSGSDYRAFIDATTIASRRVEQIATVAAEHGRAVACLQKAVAQSDAADRKRLQATLTQGLGYQQAEQLDGVSDWAASAGQLCRFFDSAITLRLVSERGVKTGIWREYDGNRRARTYYLIVDAVSGGSAVEALVQSAEDQKEYARRRFGVRVDESTFERIKRDKQDDGLLEQPEVGEKPARSLRWQLPAGYDAKFIVEW
ncbi:MAG: DUF6384 family protein [Permianibacter sp.]